MIAGSFCGSAAAQGGDDLVPRWSSRGRAIVTLTHAWSRMGDTLGTFDVDLGPGAGVSVENAQYDWAEQRIATVSKGDGSVRLFDAATGESLWVADGRAETECLAFTADDAYLVTGGEHQPEIKIWDAATGTLVRELEDNVSVEGMAFSPDFAMLACGNDAGEVRLYDTQDPDPRRWPAEPAHLITLGPDEDAGGRGHSDVNQIDWNASGTALFTASRNGSVQRYPRSRFASGYVLPDANYEGHTGSVKTVALSPDETLVASASNAFTGNGARDTPARILVHDVATAAVVLEYVIPDGLVPEVVRFTPDGQVLVAGTSFKETPETESATYVWRVDELGTPAADTPAQTITWYEQEYIDFRDDAGQWVVGASDGSVRVFDIDVDPDAEGGGDTGGGRHRRGDQPQRRARPDVDEIGRASCRER